MLIDYKPIACAEDMPACFSRPICRFALKLNDEANDKDRQRLLPFVTRLACADTPEIERARATYIGIHAFRFMSFDQGLHELEGALAIGREANPFAGYEVRTRMDAVSADGGGGAHWLTGGLCISGCWAIWARAG